MLYLWVEFVLLAELLHRSSTRRRNSKNAACVSSSTDIMDFRQN